MKRCLLMMSVTAMAAVVADTVFPRGSYGASVSPGKESAYASQEIAVALPACVGATPFLTATIAKGKKKRVLVVEGAVSTVTSEMAPNTLFIEPSVNGQPMNPDTPFVQDCGVFGISELASQLNCCSVSGVWWLDLDTNPAAFVNVPLTVELSACGGSSTNGTFIGSLVVRMQKK